MSDVSISYKGAEIASLDDSGTKMLLTSGKYCGDDIEVVYTKPSGGGVKEYAGSFTLVNDGMMPTITHNLGTDKIAVLIFPADNSTVIPHAGYITYSVVYINLNALLGGRTITLDYTKYNSTRFPEPLTKTVSTANTGFRFSNGNPSPWTSQSDWEQGNYSGVSSGHTATSTTYRYTAKNMAAGTYDVFIWALGD